MLSRLRCRPVTVTSAPGATRGEPSAELTTLVRCGVRTAASKVVGISVIPDCDNETIVPWLARTASVRLKAEEPRTITGVTVIVPGAGVTAAATGVNNGASVRRDVARRTSRLLISIL